MKIKKILAIVLSLVLVFSTFALTVNAEESGEITVTSLTGKAGEEVSITIEVTKNPGISSAIFQIYYDENLEIVSITDQNLYPTATVSPNYQSNPYVFNYVDNSNFNSTSEGVLATINFKIPDYAQAGDTYDIEVKYDEYNTYDSNFNNIAFDTVKGIVTVEGQENKDLGSANVDAIYTQGQKGDTVYSVDITWGDLDFEYIDADQGNWNPETHSYKATSTGSWSWINNSNLITVTNHSNTAVNIGMNFTPTKLGITGDFFTATKGGNLIDNDKLNLANAEGTSVTSAPSANAFFQVTGGSVTSNGTIGNITLTISD